MKKHFYLVLSLLISFSSLAQIGNFEPKASVSLLVNTPDKIPQLEPTVFKDNWWSGNGETTNKSFSLGMAGKFFLKNKTTCFVLKIGLSKTALENKWPRGYIATGNTTVYSKLSMNSIYIIPGMQINAPYRFLNFFGGLNLPFMVHGKANVQSDSEFGFGSTQGIFRAGYAVPGGFSTGLGLETGMNVFLVKKISLGMQVALDMLYTKMGGHYNVITKKAASSTFSSYNTTVVTSETTSLEKFYLAPKFSIGLSYWFGSTPSIKNPVK